MRRLYIPISLLLVSSLAVAQNAPAPDPSQPAANPSGGWRRVGDPPPDTANGPSYPAYSADQSAQAGDPNQPAPNYAPPSPPQPMNQAPAPPQQAPYQQGPYQQPSYQQGPYQQGPYQQPPYNANQQPNYPPAPSPVPAQLTIPAGTFVTARINQMLSSDKNAPGDAFSATLVEPVVANGVVVAEPGQTIGGRVVMVQKHSTGNPAKLGIELTTLTLVDGQQVPLHTQLTSRRGGTTPGGVEAGTIVATTGFGAAVGAAAAWGTGAAIGAGAGALAGIIGVVVTHNHASVIHPEQVLTFRMEAPVTISTQNSPQAFRYVQPGEYDRPYYGGAPGPYSQYTAAGPAQAPYYFPYYGSPYPYWGPSFAFYWGPGYWWGGRYYHGYYGRGFVRR